MTLPSLGRLAWSIALLGAVAAPWGGLAEEAKAAWLEPVAASEAEARVEDPQLGIDAAGNTTVVWTSGNAPSRSIRSAFRPTGGSWEAPFTRMTSTFDCHDPRLAVNSAGAAVVVAECEKNSSGIASPAIRAAYRPAGSWNGQVEIPGSAGGNEPRGGITPNGDVDVVWAGAGPTVLAAHRPAAGSWSTGASIGAGESPNLAVSPGGYAFAIWRNGSEVSTSRRSPTTGTWTAATKLNSLGSVAVGEPQIAIGVHGQRMMAWSQQGTHQVMAERTSGGDLSGINEPPVLLTESGEDVEVPRIAVDGTGLGVATWRIAGDSSSFPIRGATTPFINGAWSAKTTLGGPTTGVTQPEVAVAPDGRATVVWVFGGSVFATTRPAGGAFPALSPATISSAALSGFQGPTVTATSGGDALVAWSTASKVAVAVDDVTPPAITALSAPSTVEVGTAAALSATATDAWSAVSLAWDFGDGATASGATVDHAYANAGTYTVTLTATDGGGNSSSSTAPVTVTATPGGGGTDDGGGAGGGPGTGDPGSGGGTGGPSPPGSGGPHKPAPQTPKVRVTATVVAQPWAKLKQAQALKLRCTLDVGGRCAVVATVTRGVAKKLGLPAPKKGTAPVRIGSGAAPAPAGRPTVVTVKLAARALKRIAAVAKRVPVTLEATGTAPGADPGTASRRTTLRPPALH